ncbi:LacI family transcriptional regulator [Pantoea stewartii subsp. indologenes]|uniref:LacI family DNA-binding transcriptional regulator n=1 Tax=Pantoea stewartii TaxID=66269 RepID=UPI0005101BF9|nr:LacI family DNA-binding transcriptional regulator [Pantoea stewartii]KGD81025.1 LacI family transcriptional regulator [Pantoea stewartii subsp. indologenes]
MKKISMSAVARAAGVGVATVDRVLNNRASVKQETRDRVLRAAEALGYREDLRKVMTPEATAVKSAVRTGFILLPSDYSFYQVLSEEIRRYADGKLATEPAFVWADIHDVEKVVSSLEALAKRVDIIGVVALDHPLIRHTIKQLSASGVQIFTLFSDLSPCGQAGYIGLDNLKAGRTAGWFAERMMEKDSVIGVLLGDHRFNCQESCEISFRSYLRENRQDAVVLEPLQTRESISGGYLAASQLLKNHPSVTMIYAPCGGIEGVIKAVCESARHDIKILCHGPFIGDEMALIAGHVDVMIRHRIDVVAETIVSVFIRRHQETDRNPLSVTVPFDLVTRENI